MRVYFVRSRLKHQMLSAATAEVETQTAANEALSTSVTGSVVMNARNLKPSLKKHLTVARVASLPAARVEPVA